MNRKHRSVITGLALSLILSSTPTQLALANNEIEFNSGETRVSLIELFTSEGCCSCPPAEAWLNSFKTDRDLWKKVIPVAFHVDYWDDLGWKDRFATQGYSNRQYQYKQDQNIRSVYTPGFVVNGKEWRGWFRRSQPVLSTENKGNLTIKVNNLKVTANYQSTSQIKSYTLNIAVLGFGIDSNIKAGENGGKQLKHDFVALSHQQKASNSGQWNFELPDVETDSATQYALAAWVSETGNQTPIQATGGWLKWPLNYK